MITHEQPNAPDVCGYLQKSHSIFYGRYWLTFFVAQGDGANAKQFLGTNAKQAQKRITQPGDDRYYPADSVNDPPDNRSQYGNHLQQLNMKATAEGTHPKMDSNVTKTAFTIVVTISQSTHTAVVIQVHATQTIFDTQVQATQTIWEIQTQASQNHEHGAQSQQSR